MHFFSLTTGRYKAGQGVPHREGWGSQRHTTPCWWVCQAACPHTTPLASLSLVCPLDASLHVCNLSGYLVDKHSPCLCTLLSPHQPCMTQLCSLDNSVQHKLNRLNANQTEQD